MRWSAKIAIGAVTIVAASFLVPDLREASWSAEEYVREIKLSRAGDRLLLRTSEHDYEWKMPAHRLREIPPRLLAGLNGNKYDMNLLEFGAIEVNAGVAKAPMWIEIGGFDPNASGNKTILSRAQQDLLSGFGFAGSVESENPLDPPLSMRWRAQLSGRRYPIDAPVNQGKEFDGIDLTSLKRYTVRVNNVIDEATAKRNRRLNQLFAPLRKVRDTATMVVMVIVAVPVMLFTGFRPGA